MSPVNFIKVHRERTNSDFYIQSGRAYTVQKRAIKKSKKEATTSKKIYLRCIQWSETRDCCPGRASIEDNATDIHVYKKHTCVKNLLIGDILQAKEDCRRLAAKEVKMEPEQVRAEVAKRYSEEVMDLLPLPELYSTLKKQRKRDESIPVKPKISASQKMKDIMYLTMKGIKYSIVHRERTDSDYYIQSGRAYLVHKRATDVQKTYLRCIKWSETRDCCPGRGYIEGNACFIYIYNKHTCPKNPLIADILQAKEDCCQLAAQEPHWKPYEVRKEIAKRYSAEVMALLPLAELYQTLKRQRKRKPSKIKASSSHSMMNVPLQIPNGEEFVLESPVQIINSNSRIAPKIEAPQEIQNGLPVYKQVPVLVGWLIPTESPTQRPILPAVSRTSSISSVTPPMPSRKIHLLEPQMEEVEIVRIPPSASLENKVKPIQSILGAALLAAEKKAAEGKIEITSASITNSSS